MTCQVAYGSPTKFASLVMDIKAANALSLSDGHEAALPVFEARCAAAIDGDGLSGLTGTFVVIETVGGLLVSAGVGRELVKRDVALEAVEAHFVELRAAAGAATAEEREAWDWRNVVQMNYCVEAVALLRMLAPDALVFGCRSYVATPGATKLSGGWALGYYHGLAHNELVRLGGNVLPPGKQQQGAAGASRKRRVSGVLGEAGFGFAAAP